MKSKIIDIKTVIIIVLIGIIISLILIILNMKNKNIVAQQIVKEQLGETTSDNAYVEAQLHFKEIEDEQKKLLSFKSSIATAITNQGVITSSTDTENTMVANIGKIQSTLNIENLQLVASSKDSTIVIPDDCIECIIVITANGCYNVPNNVTGCEYTNLYSDYDLSNGNRYTKLQVIYTKNQNGKTITIDSDMNSCVSNIYKL